MMFLLDSAFALELIAVVLSSALLIWSLRNQGVGISLGRIIGSVALVLGILALLCTTYYGLKYGTIEKRESSKGFSLKIQGPNLD